MRFPRTISTMIAPIGAAALVGTGLLAVSPAVAATAVDTVAPTTAAVDVDRGVTHDQNPLVPVGASWTEHYFSSPQADSPTKVELHADVLRPTTVAKGERTPVIVSVGPYFSHAGQTGRETDETGPSPRFADLIEGAKLMDRGYTVVLVDLRGFGGSTGCIDWLGPGEQADIKRSVEWSAAQKWSTGKVGTYGKSYDASTGLWANNLAPKGLEAVVAQEPLWNGYNYYYSNEVARPNNTGTPRAYNGIAVIPGTTGDTDKYKANAAYESTHPECLTQNLTSGRDNTRETDQYWLERDAIGSATGSDTPIFFTQGFTESNTKPEQMEEFLANHVGTERGWMGPWEHVRGNETDPTTGQLLQGRAGFFDEVIRFYDLHLKGRAPNVVDPNFAIQDSTGKWRAQSSWPGTSRPGTVKLARGAYLDNGQRAIATEVTNGAGQMDAQVRSKLVDAVTSTNRSAAAAEADASTYFNYSKPVKKDSRLTATPSITLQTKGTGDVMVRLYDVDPATGEGVMINENVARLKGNETSFDLKSMDWTLATGHQLAVGIGTIDPRGYWRPQPSGATVKVTGAFLDLDSQSPAKDVPTQGNKSAFLDDYISRNTVAFADITGGSFAVPAPR